MTRPKPWHVTHAPRGRVESEERRRRDPGTRTRSSGSEGRAGTSASPDVGPREQGAGHRKRGFDCRWRSPDADSSRTTNRPTTTAQTALRVQQLLDPRRVVRDLDCLAGGGRAPGRTRRASTPRSAASRPSPAGAAAAEPLSRAAAPRQSTGAARTTRDPSSDRAELLHGAVDSRRARRRRRIPDRTWSRRARRAGGASRRSPSAFPRSSARCAPRSSARARSPEGRARSSRRRAGRAAPGTVGHTSRATRRTGAAPRRRGCRRRATTCPSRRRR